MPVYFTEKGYKNYRERISGLEKKLDELQYMAGEATEDAGNTWHDNFAYEDLCRQISVMDRRLSDEHKLISDGFDIISYPKEFDCVGLGCKAKILLDGKERTYQIVAYGESDVDNNKILYTSPLAQAIMCCKIGDEVNAEVVGRKRNIKILGIEPILNGKE